MKTFLRRWWILQKRLLKKPAFLAILLLIPLLVGAMSLVSTGERSGIVTVALAAQNSDDPLSQELLSSLADSSTLMTFMVCDSPSEASTLVESGRADAAWIFPDGLQEKMEAFLNHIHGRNAFVVVVQREDNVLLRLSQEKLNAALYPYLSRCLYRQYLYDHILTLDDLTPEQLDAYYDAVNAEGEALFAFAYPEGTPADAPSPNYLTSPLRGLMAILVMLGGLAAAMFCLQDQARGTFDRLPRGKRFGISVICHGTAVSSVALAMLAALFFAGMTVSVWRELAAMGLYILIATGFCMGVGLICRDLRVLGAVLPLLTVGMIVLCPIFFELPSLAFVSRLLPPYYYLGAIHDARYLGQMALYGGMVFSLDLALYQFLPK